MRKLSELEPSAWAACAEGRGCSLGGDRRASGGQSPKHAGPQQSFVRSERSFACRGLASGFCSPEIRTPAISLWAPELRTSPEPPSGSYGRGRGAPKTEHKPRAASSANLPGPLRPKPALVHIHATPLASTGSEHHVPSNLEGAELGPGRGDWEL